MHISVLNGELWDMGQVHCGICLFRLFSGSVVQTYKHNILSKHPNIAYSVPKKFEVKSTIEGLHVYFLVVPMQAVHTFKPHECTQPIRDDIRV